MPKWSAWNLTLIRLLAPAVLPFQQIQPQKTPETTYPKVAGSVHRSIASTVRYAQLPDSALMAALEAA